MTNVSFEEETYQTRSKAVAPSGGLSALVQKLGLAKDAKGASYVLLIIAILSLAATVAVLASTFNRKESASPLPVTAQPRFVAP